MVSCRFSLKPIHWDIASFKTFPSSGHLSRRGSHQIIYRSIACRGSRIKNQQISDWNIMRIHIGILHIINHIYIHTYIYIHIYIYTVYIYTYTVCIYIYIYVCVCVCVFVSYFLKTYFVHPKRDSASRSWTIPTWVWAWRRIRWLGDSMRNHSPTPLNQGRDSTLW